MVLKVNATSIKQTKISDTGTSEHLISCLLCLWTFLGKCCEKMPHRASTPRIAVISNRQERMPQICSCNNQLCCTVLYSHTAVLLAYTGAVLMLDILIYIYIPEYDFTMNRLLGNVNNRISQCSHGYNIDQCSFYRRNPASHTF